jgi:hypothetical protein
MIKRKILLLFYLLIIHITLFAQLEGDQWVIGYWGPSGYDQSIMFMDFRFGKLHIYKHTEFKMGFLESASNICNGTGEPLLWTNGMQIMVNNGSIIADTIAYDGKNGYWNHFYNETYNVPFGFPDMNGAVILPMPNNPTMYSVLYPLSGTHPTLFYDAVQFLEAKVNQTSEGEFELVYKDLPFGPYVEWLNYTISAVRHGNGRDWWLIYFENNSPNYYASILDPDGVHYDHLGSVDSIVRYGLGQAVFSPKGNYMARLDAISPDDGQIITLYNFDRCTGDLERKANFQTPFGLFTGVAFSPSEQYLYADNNNSIWQWDLRSDDIAASQTLVDTFDGFIQPGWFEMDFGPMVNGPDGKIYIVPSAGSSKYMHVIDQPDLPASECRLWQHYTNLHIWNDRTAPNLPNFRLGPLDGSPCDTLGLNNLPVSRWRKEQDIQGIQSPILFTDLSFYDPQTWLWDFDDGSTSMTPSPLHSFEPGLYHVCLSVSNEYGSDSSCQWVNILPTGIKEEMDRTPDIDILPNPFKEYISITSRSDIFRTASLQLYDMHGRLVFDQPELTIPVNLFLPDFPPGVYLCTIKDEDGSVRSVKLMKE